MKSFIPYDKLTKKKRRELDKKRRSSWGGMSPVTRKSPDPKVYRRTKARQWNDESADVLF